MDTVDIDRAADLISLQTARNRSRTGSLEVVDLDGTLVGCSTMRAPADVTGLGRLIVLALLDFRERGIGTAMFVRGMAHARSLGATIIETVVLGTQCERPPIRPTQRLHRGRTIRSAGSRRLDRPTPRPLDSSGTELTASGDWGRATGSAALFRPARRATRRHRPVPTAD